MFIRLLFDRIERNISHEVLFLQVLVVGQRLLLAHLAELLR